MVMMILLLAAAKRRYGVTINDGEWCVVAVWWRRAW